jgi:DNA modification methylase
MGGERAACIFSDLPYNVSYQANESVESLKARNRRTDGKVVENDDDPAVAILGFRHMLEVAEPGAGIYLCFPAEQPQHLAAMWEEPAYLQSMIIWLKDRMVMGRKDHYYQHEPLWYGWKLGAAHRWYGGHQQTTVWQIDRPFDSEDHPTEKPLGLPQRAIENTSKRGDIVVDFFAGTGTTLTAAHRTGRHARLCEISPRYADVILRRAEAEGLTVERANG